MRANMLKKSLIVGIFFLLLLLLAGNASSEVEPIYAGWTVGNSWGGYGTILRSTDSGETWIRQGDGQIADVNLSGVFAVDPYTAWVVGDSHDGYATIYHTTDGGTTWERKGSSDLASPDYVPDVALAKVHARGGDVWAVGNPVVILHTNDGGVTWKNQIPAEYENGRFSLQGVYALDSNTVWVTGHEEVNQYEGVALILKTTDGGKHWTRQSGTAAEDADHILGISAADADTAWAVGGEYIVLKTTDGGTTWEHQIKYGMIQDVNEVYAVNSSTIWIAYDYNIWLSTNGGDSWKNCIEGGTELAMMGISAVSDQEAWGSHYYYSWQGQYGFIFHTADGCNTWTKIEQLNGKQLPGLWTISFATQPIYPDYLIISMIEDVEKLVDDRILNKGQGHAIIVKLEKALDRLDNDRRRRNRGAAKRCLRRSKRF